LHSDKREWIHKSILLVAVLVSLRDLLILKKAIDSHLDNLIFAFHFLKFYLLFLLRQLCEHVVAHEG